MWKNIKDKIVKFFSGNHFSVFKKGKKILVNQYLKLKKKIFMYLLDCYKHYKEIFLDILLARKMSPQTFVDKMFTVIGVSYTILMFLFFTTYGIIQAILFIINLIFR